MPSAEDSNSHSGASELRSEIDHAGRRVAEADEFDRAVGRATQTDAVGSSSAGERATEADAVITRIEADEVAPPDAANGTVELGVVARPGAYERVAECDRDADTSTIAAARDVRASPAPVEQGTACYLGLLAPDVSAE
jgi:hypothetical protein